MARASHPTRARLGSKERGQPGALNPGTDHHRDGEKTMKCSQIEMNPKAMNSYYSGFEIYFYEGNEVRKYRTFGRADKAARKYVREGRYCELVGWFTNGYGGITREQICAC